MAEGDARPSEVLPPPSSRTYWTRQGLAEWLVERLSEDKPTFIGIDHGFSFPLKYFDHYQLPHDWSKFLDDFQNHWPTDKNIWVDNVRHGTEGNGNARKGDPRWRRLTELRCRGKSVFHFDVPGSAAKSSHSGLPWLRFIRKQLGDTVHFWPFDGWSIPNGKSVIAEVYPALFSHSFAKDGRTDDQHDAFSVAAWLSEIHQNGKLNTYLQPSFALNERATAEIEGWILGVL
jgi:hypothetical protein